MNRYTSFTKLLRVFAYVQRFKSRLQNHSDTPSISLSTDGLELSSRALINIVQHYYFAHEFINIKNGNEYSKLCKLSPFVDEQLMVVCVMQL